MEITQDINCTEAEGCECDDCVKARAEFNAWCDQTEQRWAEAALTAPSGVVLEVVR